MIRYLLHLSLIAYAISWFAPVIEMSGDLFSGTSRGWQAFLFAISPVLGNGFDGGVFASVVMVTSALTNVLYVAALVRAYLRPATSHRLAGWALVGAALVNTAWPTLFEMAADLRFGYYLWWAAFALGAAGLLRRS
jgi:hypothetical protein